MLALCASTTPNRPCSSGTPKSVAARGELPGARRASTCAGSTTSRAPSPRRCGTTDRLLAEPGQAYRRGRGSSPGLIMAALGDRPAREVTTREVEDLLRTIAATGAAPRTVNKARQLVCAIFNYGMRPTAYRSLPTLAERPSTRYTTLAKEEPSTGGAPTVTVLGPGTNRWPRGPSSSLAGSPRQSWRGDSAL